MTNLIEAITDLKETIKTDGFNADLVQEIAADYEVNAALLLRKFTEQTGKAPAEFVVNKIEIDYETKYNAAMHRAWHSHEKMLWANLTATEQESAKRVIDQNLGNDKLRIVWK